MSELLARLQSICGPEHVSDVLADRLCYRRDCGPTPGGVPDIVVRPESTAEVVEIVKLANEVRKPIFLWGRATTFVDFGVQEGCIVMALDLMNRILKIDLENQIVTAETGAIWHAVDSELNKLGWEMAVPGGGGMFSCTVGGTVAYNAVPHGITEYGVTGEHVVALEVVLPDGTVIHTGSAANTDAPLPIERGANGPDLTGLFIGSCGTLGVITEVTLRIHRIPECERFLFYAFDRLDDAVDAASAIQSQQAATFLIGLFGGPKPDGVEGEAFLHAIIRDTTVEAERRVRAVQVCCETFQGRRQDSQGTRRYWTEHMYSWLRNTPASAYYGGRPYYCPEVAGFMPTQALKEAIYDVYQFDPLILINLFHLQSSETLENLSPELFDDIQNLTLRSLERITALFRSGIEGGLFETYNPEVLAELFWSLFSGMVLWEESKRIFENDNYFLKDTLDMAFGIFLRGIGRPEEGPFAASPHRLGVAVDPMPSK